MGPRTRRVALAHSAYFVATGVAPFVSRRAFEAVTGPKREWWLVETVGVAVTAAGASVGLAALRREATAPSAVLALGTAAGLGAIDVAYWRAGRLRWTYLLDAAVEAAAVAAWIAALRAEGGAGGAAPSA